MGSLCFILSPCITSEYAVMHYTVRLNKKVYTFQKSPHINISKYFQEIVIHVGSCGYLLSNDTNKSDDIVYLSEQEPRLSNWPKPGLDRN